MTCFTPGTAIATPTGARAVEALAPGDRVITRDNGIREIVWVGQKVFDFAELTRQPHLGPVFVTQGSFGGGLPQRDTIVAPNQRFLVSSERTMLPFADHEALIAAKHLENSRDIRAVPVLGVTYIHIMCDRHEVVLANGCWCELFQPADHSLNGLGNAQRNELSEIFPALSAQPQTTGPAPTGRTH
ncbi:MAG: Hint domain-containing protein [Proteobacteria bacterium]|nr:Hint domain-containing protein [Pseudomonadota bacterium]